MARKKKVVVLATGGTIAGTGRPGAATAYESGTLSIGKIASSVYGLEDLADLEEIQVANINSDDITSSIWLRLAKTINEAAKRDDVDGFVITHGTDTMEETAYFLHLVLKTDKPVVVTGAMRPSTATSADGPMNLYQAVTVAASEKARGMGVMCVFSDSIYSARDFQKLSTTSVTAFGGRDFGMMGYVLDGNVMLYSSSTRPHTVESEFSAEGLETLPKVGILLFHVDADPSLVETVASASDGLVLVGAGNGNYSKAYNEAIGRTSVPVVRTSRIANGMIVPDSTFDKWGNVIVGDNLAPTKARILLQLSLTKTKDISRIREFFRKY
ncbi:MAG: asparaginase [Candidatus Ornithospirochaeta sp.]